MPVHCPVEIRVLEPDEFKELDYRVMGHAFACQNELGRMCEEGIYRADLALRLAADGFQVPIQVPVFVQHGDFVKRYYLDLLANHALYEVKAATTLIGEHKAQLLNYMFLLGLRCGKLLNFRPDKVQGQLVLTGLTPEIRRRIAPDTTRWQVLAEQCRVLHDRFLDILADWGGFLELPLYEEALTHFLGGPEQVIQRLRMNRGESQVGSQRMHIHAPGVGFVVTAFSEENEAQELHLRKLLAHAPLTALQWINLEHATVRFITLTK